MGRLNDVEKRLDALEEQLGGWGLEGNGKPITTPDECFNVFEKYDALICKSRKELGLLPQEKNGNKQKPFLKSELDYLEYISKLLSTLSETQENLKKADSHLKNTHQLYEGLQGEHEDLQGAHDDVVVRWEKSDKMLLERCNDLSKCQSSLIQLEGQLRGKCRNLESCQAELVKVKNLSTKDEVMAGWSDLKAELYAANERNRKMEFYKDQLNADLDSVLVQEADAKATIKKLEDTVKALDKKLSGRSNALATAQKGEASAYLALDRKTQQNSRNKGHIIRLGEQVRKLHLENNDWKAQADVSNAHLQAAWKKVAKIEASVETTAQQIRENNKSRFQITLRVQALEDTNNGLVKVNQAQSRRIMDLESKGEPRGLTYTAPTCPHCGCSGVKCAKDSKRITTPYYYCHCGICGCRVIVELQQFPHGCVQLLSIVKEGNHVIDTE